MPFLRTSAFVLALSVLALPSAVTAAPKQHGSVARGPAREARSPAKAKGPAKAERCRLQNVKVQRQGRTVTVKKTVCTPTKPSPRR